MAKSGFGRHIETLTVQERIDARFYFVISTWPALLAIGVCKVAIAGLHCRVFDPGVWVRYFLWGLALLGLLNYVAESAFSTFQCIPVQAFWDVRIQTKTCVSRRVYRNFYWYIDGTARKRTSLVSELCVTSAVLG